LAVVEDWSQWLIDSRYDERGASIEWKTMKLRVARDVVDGIALRGPSWATCQLEPEFARLGCRPVKVNAPSAAEWDRVMMVPAPRCLDQRLHRLLAVLSEVKSVGRCPVGDGVDHCLALDLYKVPDAERPSDEWANTPVGELVNRYKYRGVIASDMALRDLADQLSKVVEGHPVLKDADCIISIPGRDTSKAGHGERLAAAVARRTDKAFFRTLGLYEVRPEAKAGEYVLTPDQVEVNADVFIKDRVIIVDDVLRSGHSMAAVATKARSAGAECVFGLVAAKTLRN
jgi:hypothetical protein